MPKTSLDRIAEFYGISLEQAATVTHYYNLLQNELIGFFSGALIVRQYQPRAGVVTDITDIAVSVVESLPFSSAFVGPVATIIKGVDQYMHEKDPKLGLKFAARIGYESVNKFVKELCNQLLEARLEKIKDRSLADVAKQVKSDFRGIIEVIGELDLENITPIQTIDMIPANQMSPDAHQRDLNYNLELIISQILPEVVEEYLRLETPASKIKTSYISRIRDAGTSLISSAKKAFSRRRTEANQSSFNLSPFQIKVLEEVKEESLSPEILEEMKKQGLSSATKTGITAYKINHQESDFMSSPYIESALKNISQSLKKNQILEADEAEEIFAEIIKIEAFSILRDQQESLSPEILEEMKKQGLSSATKTGITAYKINHQESDFMSSPYIESALKNIIQSLKKNQILEADEAEEIFAEIIKIEAFSILRDQQELYENAQNLRESLRKSLELDNIRENLFDNDDNLRRVLFSEEDPQEVFYNPLFDDNAEDDDLEKKSGDDLLMITQARDSRLVEDRNWWRGKIKIMNQSGSDTNQLIPMILKSLKELIIPAFENEKSSETKGIENSETYLGEEYISFAKRSLSAIHDFLGKNKVTSFTQELDVDSATNESDISDRMVYLLISGKTLGDVEEYEKLEEKLTDLTKHGPRTTTEKGFAEKLNFSPNKETALFSDRTTRR